MLTFAPLLLLVPVPQAPPCLGSPQDVVPLSSSVPGYSLRLVRVAGPRALTLGESVDAAGAPSVHIDTYEAAPQNLLWAAQSSITLPGRLSPSSGFGRTFDLDGDRAAFAIFDSGQRSLVILERDASGAWAIDDIVPSATHRIEHVRLSGERVAMGVDTAARIEIWADAPSGWVLDGVIQEDPGSVLNFTTEFDLEGDRLVSNARGWGLETYRRQAAGSWVRESNAPNAGGYYLDPWFEPAFFASGRWAQVVWQPGTNTAAGIGFWRVSQDGLPTRSIFDGVMLYSDLPYPRVITESGAFDRGTLVAPSRFNGCTSSTSGLEPGLAVIRVGAGDVPRLEGSLCFRTGASPQDSLVEFDYGGGALAATVRLIGSTQPSIVRFWSLLGADDDRNANCEYDGFEIALDPLLDRNLNGILDATEIRGSTDCVPVQPNTSGSIASLEVIGTEFHPTTDLAASVRGLPANSFGFLAVARTPQPVGPFGLYGLCIGSGPISAFGRYPAFQADAQGNAWAALPSTAFQGPAHVPGDTWGWQYIYRDGSGFGTGPAVRVTLR
ncbi:hypothetical protein Poly30_02640 [Planctomycetes bacterium Poly30]|uniref:Uncharacterized protein n=1 Tax=Saltatorellus ferox TaxID=2528018 RepID=A0A518EL49_9BACT|nr:hypothetical protein Poly30_02640 [Planctomycetes bacterium Poly30]